MGAKLVVMGGLALAFGATSYYAGNQYLESHTQAQLNEWESSQVPREEIELTKVVVAEENLPFGTKIEAEHLKLVAFPAESVPEGSFSNINDMLGEKGRRVVVAINSGEPVLASKVTGKDGRGGLAEVIGDGMRAVTIPVNGIDGVGGFVQPGDRVDIVFTHEDREERASSRIIMSNIKVLSVDQEAGERKQAAQVAKSVTLETDSAGAQKLALAKNIGKLSLLLRAAGDVASNEGLTISADQLAGKPVGADGSGNLNSFLSMFQGDPNQRKMTSVTVTMFDKSQSVDVPMEKNKLEETQSKTEER